MCLLYGFSSHPAANLMEGDVGEFMDTYTLAFFRFMASRPGRLLRAAVGISMIVGGFAADGPAGIAFAVMGMVPLVSAVLDLCLLAPLWGLPLLGTELRLRLNRPSIKVRGPHAG